MAAEESEDNLTPNTLGEYWRSITLPRGAVCGFYGHSKGDFKSFSNFYEHEAQIFKIPDCCWNQEFKDANISQIVDNIKFSEKSIMLCKAALFKDQKAFETIKALRKPQQCKQAGREVRNFDKDIWNENVLTIAYEVVLQKFSQLTYEKNILLSTNHSLIAEASPRDRIWGIGLGSHQPETQDPKLWLGTNILGWALMKARKEFQREYDKDDNNINREKNKKSKSVDENKIGAASSSSCQNEEKNENESDDVTKDKKGIGVKRETDIKTRMMMNKGIDSLEEFPAL